MDYWLVLLNRLTETDWSIEYTHILTHDNAKNRFAIIDKNRNGKPKNSSRNTQIMEALHSKICCNNATNGSHESTKSFKNMLFFVQIIHNIWIYWWRARTFGTLSCLVIMYIGVLIDLKFHGKSIRAVCKISFSTWKTSVSETFFFFYFHFYLSIFLILSFYINLTVLAITSLLLFFVVVVIFLSEQM